MNAIFSVPNSKIGSWTYKNAFIINIVPDDFIGRNSLNRPRLPKRDFVRGLSSACILINQGLWINTVSKRASLCLLASSLVFIGSNNMFILLANVDG